MMTCCRWALSDATVSRLLVVDKAGTGSRRQRIVPGLVRRGVEFGDAAHDQPPGTSSAFGSYAEARPRLRPLADELERTLPCTPVSRSPEGPVCQLRDSSGG